MQPVNLVYQQGRFSAASGADHEILDREMGEGEVITTELRPVASDGQKAFWAMINAAYKHRPAIATRWDSPEDLANAVKIAIKHRSTGESLNGSPYFIARSLAGVKDWEGFNGAVKACLMDKLDIPEEVLLPPKQEETAPVDEAQPDDERAEEPAPAPEPEKPKRAPAAKRAKGDNVIPMPDPLAMECATKMLVFAEDRESFGDNTIGQLKTLANITADWIETLPEHKDFIEIVSDNCEKIIACSPADHAKRKRWHDYVMACIPTIEERKGK